MTGYTDDCGCGKLGCDIEIKGNDLLNNFMRIPNH